MSRVFTASVAFAGTYSARLPLVPLPGGHFGVARFTLCCGLLFRFPFSGSYLASAHRVIPTHWRSATWPPVSYHDRTLTGEQMTTFQDTLGSLPTIGSGTKVVCSLTIESACKQIAAVRLKRSGARWTLPGVIATAKARAVWLSQSWDSLKPNYARLPSAT